MKLTIILLLTINTCMSQDSLKTSEINYEAYTRGSSITLKVNEHQLFYKGYDSEKTIRLHKKEWESILNFVSKIDLEKLNTRNPPSDKRATDAALHAKLKIKHKGKGYESQTFDHGNPPEKLVELIDKLFELAGIKD